MLICCTSVYGLRIRRTLIGNPTSPITPSSSPSRRSSPVSKGRTVLLFQGQQQPERY
uniref:Uncharacterized protein n=1 Tax=Lepeophtheirus salmonis TaxID=72036 RepID=A0A0K2TBG0_LEPSM